MDRMQKLHWLVQAVVNIQQFLNACNLRHQPHGEWDHFPPAIFEQPKRSLCAQRCSCDRGVGGYKPHDIGEEVEWRPLLL